MKNKKNLDLNKLEPKLDESLNKSLTAREHNTPLIEQLLNETTPQEMAEIDKQMSEKPLVKWLKQQLETHGDPQRCIIEWEELDALIEQAKAMEKEEKIKFATDFFFWWYNQINGTNTYEAVEKFYNETYGGNK